MLFCMFPFKNNYEIMHPLDTGASPRTVGHLASYTRQDKTDTESTQVSLAVMGFELTIPAFERAKIYRAVTYFSIRYSTSYWKCV
jgi:hypothetical protein